MYRATRVVPVLCLAVAVGCGQLLGASDFEVGHSKPDSGGACEAFGLPADSACRTCQFDNCCAESIACRDDATCSAFARCMARCSHDDGACLAWRNTPQ